jgi:hypothetical protein
VTQNTYLVPPQANMINMAVPKNSPKMAMASDTS